MRIARTGLVHRFEMRAPFKTWAGKAAEDTFL